MKPRTHLILALIAVAFAAVFVARWVLRQGAPHGFLPVEGTLQAVTREVTAPLGGIIAAVGIEPGEEVPAGTILFEIQAPELERKRDRLVKEEARARRELEAAEQVTRTVADAETWIMDRLGTRPGAGSEIRDTEKAQDTDDAGDHVDGLPGSELLEDISGEVRKRVPRASAAVRDRFAREVRRAAVAAAEQLEPIEKQIRERLQETRRELAAVQQLLDQREIIAAEAAVPKTVHVAPGARVEAGALLATLAVPGVLRLEARLPTGFDSEAVIGQEARLRVGADGPVLVGAVVAGGAPGRVVIEVASPPATLPPGVAATGAINMAGRDRWPRQYRIPTD